MKGQHTIKSSLNDYRPVALTPIIIKCFERLVRAHIVSRLPPTSDPCWCAHRPNRSSELHLILEHLEGKNQRMLVLDLSSAFNTIISQHLVSKLAPLIFNTPICNWLFDFLTNRPQSVQMG